jgi:site-specific DNA-cytosine methylase
MSEDQTTQQMLLLEDFHANHSALQEKEKEQHDDRYLWDETIRVVAECKPRWFIGENVEGLININNGVVLRQVQTDLEDQGFQVQCLVIPASGIGAWHQRKRVWIVAYSDSNRHSNKIRRSSTKRKEYRKSIGRTTTPPGNLAEQVQYGKPTTNMYPTPVVSDHLHNQSESIENWQKRAGRKKTRDQSTLCTSSSCSDVPNTDTGFGIRENQEIQTGGNTITNGSEDVPNSNSRLRGGRGAEFQSRDDGQWGFYSKEEEQARNDIRSKVIGCDAVSEQNKTWWEAQSKLCGVPNGISYELDKDRSNRIKSLGNSIVPQIARQLGLSIMEAELSG